MIKNFRFSTFTERKEAGVFESRLLGPVYKPKLHCQGRGSLNLCM